MEDATITTTTAVPPLAQAESHLRRADSEEMAAQRRYQAAKQRQLHTRAHVRQLALQETLARTLPEAVRVRAERRALEQAQTALDAEAATLDAARRQVNRALLEARRQQGVVEEQASTHWRALRTAQVERQEATTARETLDAQEHLQTALDALAQVVGPEEADRCRTSPDTPSWVRG